MRLFDRGGSGDDPVARRRPRQRSPPPAAAKTQNEIRRVSLRRRSIPSIASRARVKVTKITNNARFALIVQRPHRFVPRRGGARPSAPPCGCLIGVAAAMTPWLGAARGSGRRHPQRPKHKTKFGAANGKEWVNGVAYTWLCSRSSELSAASFVNKAAQSGLLIASKDH